MNRNKLKSYAPEARRDFIQAVTDRAALYGLTATTIEPMTEEGDVAIIAGRAFPRSVGEKRKKLAARIGKLGFEQTIEAVAYTWFNRLVAIRFMELHGYLEHGYRVLSHGEGHAQPEIVEHAEHVDLPGLAREKVIELKLDGTKEEELYRMLLIAQCNALHRAMPFLFESIDDETELLLPDHLLHSDSLIRKLVGEIPEEDWQEVEIIGWLYQFYISEKKDEVIGKVVKSEDIPAATQLFTPNWIVKYLVQNSLGRQWVATYPNSPLKGQMEYYIEPAEQTAEVQAQLDEITPDSLNPEELTLLDPACGSGHILVEAYDLLKAIYQERGYRAKDIPRLILEKNLFGLEIDDRAEQLAAFALMMKARADDRSIFERDVQPHVLAIQESMGLDAREITEALNQPIFKGETPPPESLFEEIDDEKAPLFSRKNLSEPGQVPLSDVVQLIDLFEHGKTFGSLIQVPEKLATKLPVIGERVGSVMAHGGMFEKVAARTLTPLVGQARLLVGNYDAVVTNPPYMGSKYYSPTLKSFVNANYKHAKADLYACFMQRNTAATTLNGFVGMITIPNWMFIATFTGVRSLLFDNCMIDTFIHNGRGAFGSDFGSCSFVFRKGNLPSYKGTFRRLFDKQGSVSSNDELEERFHTSTNFTSTAADFERIPGRPVAYWISESMRAAFENSAKLIDLSTITYGMFSCDHDRFLRLWFEVDSSEIWRSRTAPDGTHPTQKYCLYNKGGSYRKWAGNFIHVVDFDECGDVIRRFRKECGQSYSLPGEKWFFKEGITWSDVTISAFSARLMSAGHVFDKCAPSAFFATRNDAMLALGLLNSHVMGSISRILNPTVHFNLNDFEKLPLARTLDQDRITHIASEAIKISQGDWDSFETSWDFQTLPILDCNAATLQQSQQASDAECLNHINQIQELEQENNRLFIEAYGLQNELSPEVPDEQITLRRPDREEDIKRLVSYVIGCMLGRYSLDKPGLIYAHSGNEGFEPSKYEMFPADEDGIVPLTEFHWFEDDASKRFEKFIATAWPVEHLQENLKFVAESLGPKRGESPRETIRRYLAAGFFKHHMKLYKKRPIYWLFSSGKQRGFQALVYLHRYNEGTLSRMRTEYVIPLLGKMTARLELLQGLPEHDGQGGEIGAATSTPIKRKLEKERDTIKKQRAEVQAYDEKLRHYADQRITLDLDDGIKVNYAKFGNLLAEVKAVTGKKAEA